MNLRSTVLNLLLTITPKRPWLSRLCQHYLDRYRSENNPDIHTNGELRAIEEILPKCSVVFDVGANVGKWAVLALGINPSAQIHCFEASAVTFQKLQQSPVASRVKTNHLALGEAPGEAVLHIFAPVGGMNSLYARRGLDIGRPIGEERVNVSTLADYCAQHNIEQIDFLKLDVEGHEMAVLKGGEPLLATGQIRFIQFEYGGSNIDARVFLGDFFELLGKYGYRLYKIYPDRLVPAPSYAQHMENFQYQNWLAIHD